MERRVYRKLPSPEIRARDDGATELVGYAAAFGRYSQNLGGFVELIEPGAFTDALRRGTNVAGLVNHDENWLLATTASGTLVLSQDDDGLRYCMELDPTDPDAQRAIAKISSGKLRGSSFSFQVGEDEWSQTDEGFPLRRIRSVAKLWDVGPVTFPAYTVTEDDGLAVAMRSLAHTTGRPLDDLIAAARDNSLAGAMSPQQQSTESDAEPSPGSRRIGHSRWLAAPPASD